MSSYKHWLPEEVKRFQRDYVNKNIPMSQICKIFSRTSSSISVKASELKLNRHKIAMSDKDIIKIYKSGLSCRKIANKIDCDLTSIYNVLKRNKIKKRKNKYASNKKYTYNYTFFDKIKTQESAYFLGFIYADGNIFHNTLRISLVRHDKDILNKFIKLLETDKPLIPIPKRGKDKPQFNFSVHNKYITERLKKLGVVENKSLVLIFPEWLSPKLYNHFIRGYFDGDGCISLSVRRNDYSLSFCGTKQFLNSIQRIFLKYLNVKLRKLGRKKQTKTNSYNIKYTGRIQVEIIMNWLYKDANIWMNRKRKKYEKLKIIVNKAIIKKHHRTTINFLNNSHIKQIRKMFKNRVKREDICNKFNFGLTTLSNIVYRKIPKYQKPLSSTIRGRRV
jgi:DNA invertase Pin-like site-specific DNA recombinase